ncbi:MAG: hypothetical protein WCQ16_00830 [Verrucomicrobiae bacterium]
MKSILTLLSVVCVASLGFTGCASSPKKCCHPTKICPVTKKACCAKPGCCVPSTANCPVKKTAQ